MINGARTVFHIEINGTGPLGLNEAIYTHDTWLKHEKKTEAGAPIILKNF